MDVIWMRSEPANTRRQGGYDKDMVMFWIRARLIPDKLGNHPFADDKERAP